jgi:hypothetical protein
MHALPADALALERINFSQSERQQPQVAAMMFLTGNSVHCCRLGSKAAHRRSARQASGTFIWSGRRRGGDPQRVLPFGRQRQGGADGTGAWEPV